MIYCIHHNDLDGLCSGFLLKQVYPEAICFQYDYGQDFPLSNITQNDKVFILDINPTPEDMQTLCNITTDIVWIDHHKGTIEKLPLYQESINKIQDYGHNVIIQDGIAACKLTWEFLKENFIKIFQDPISERTSIYPIPLFIEYAHKWDVWKHGDDEEILAFVSGMMSYNISVDSFLWKNLLFSTDDYVQKIVDRGRIIKQYQVQRNFQYLKTFFYEKKYKEYKLLVCNEGLTNSKFFTDHPESNAKNYDIWVAWIYNGSKYRISLYSTKVDVSKIAVSFGGGGHKGAAGFLMHELPDWIK